MNIAELEAHLRQKEKLAELAKALGPEFEALVKALDQAELNVATYVEAHALADSTRRTVLQFMSTHFAAKAGLYGAGVALGYAVPPTVVFEVLQNRVLSGFQAALLKHQEACGDPSCQTAAPLHSFLSGLAAAMNRMQAESLMEHVQRDSSGKPIVH